MKINLNKVRRQRTKATCRAIGENIESLSIIELKISDSLKSYLPEVLIRKYQKQLLLAKNDFGKFQQDLHTFYEQNAVFIKEKNLFKDFFAFCYFFYLSQTKNINYKRDVLNAYFNLLMQQFDYFTGVEEVAYGVSSEGELLITKDPYPRLDYATIEYHMKHKKEKGLNWSQLRQYFVKYGYYLKDVDEMTRHIFNDQLISNMLFQMSYMMDENTKDILAELFFPLAEGYSATPRKWMETSHYVKQLKNKVAMLHSKGVEADFKGAGDIKQILFLEKFVEDINSILINPYSSNIIAQYTYTEQVYSEKDKCKSEIVRNFDMNNYKEFISKIKPFIKKLPKGQRHSQEAVQAARQYGYVLKEDETFVKSHSKKVHKKSKSDKK